MSFYSVYNPVNFAVLPDALAQPAAIHKITQLPQLVDLGTGSGSLNAGQLLAGELLFNPAAPATWTLPDGASLLKTMGQGVDKFVGTGGILKLQVVNYGSASVTIEHGIGGEQQKTFAAIAAGTGACGCLYIKFTSETGSYLVF